MHALFFPVLLKLAGVLLCPAAPALFTLRRRLMHTPIPLTTSLVTISTFCSLAANCCSHWSIDEVNVISALYNYCCSAYLYLLPHICASSSIFSNWLRCQVLQVLRPLLLFHLDYLVTLLLFPLLFHRSFWCPYFSYITRWVWQTASAQVFSDKSFINSDILFRYGCLYCLSSRTLDSGALSRMTCIKGKFTYLHLSNQFLLLTLLMVHNLLYLAIG